MVIKLIVAGCFILIPVFDLLTTPTTLAVGVVGVVSSSFSAFHPKSILIP